LHALPAARVAVAGLHRRGRGPYCRVVRNVLAPGPRPRLAATAPGKADTPPGLLTRPEPLPLSGRVAGVRLSQYRANRGVSNPDNLPPVGRCITGGRLPITSTADSRLSFWQPDPSHPPGAQSKSEPRT